MSEVQIQNRFSFLTGQAIPVQVLPFTLAINFPKGTVGCKNVFVYAPVSNTQVVFVGGSNLGVAGTNGLPLVPNSGLDIDIDDLQKVFAVDPSGSGAQIVTVLFEG